jgi:hypothetical protein
MTINLAYQEIKRLNEELTHHSIYQKLNSIENLRIFMKYHVFAVWDFMSLLKSLQNCITCTSVPWFPSNHSPEMVYLINSIVLAEESDELPDGSHMSHLQLYLKAMDEVGADAYLFKDFAYHEGRAPVPKVVFEFVSFNYGTAKSAPARKVAASFFFGREKIIPEMFKSILEIIEKNADKYPSLIYYLKRHIEIDATTHAPMALVMFEGLTPNPEDREQALRHAVIALEKRKQLWDNILKEMK